MTNYGQVENAVQAMQLGAVNYLCKPIQPDKLSEAIFNVLSKDHEENEFYRGESPQALELYKKLKLVALSDYSVLIRGASGVGKEHVAMEIHDQSHRHNKPYITVDCGAIPEELAASEFFGHRKGAYTGRRVTHRACSGLPKRVPCFLMKSVICHIRPKHSS